MIATVIKIKKKFRNSEADLFLVILDKFANDNEMLDELVQERCEQHLGGANHGYSYTYKILDKTDSDYQKAIAQEIDKHLDKMAQHNQAINNLQRIK